MLILSTTLLAASGLTAAATIPVAVGRNGLTFEPNEIHAQEGDVLEFRFWPRHHSVVAGDFENACRPAANGGFYSASFPTQQGTVNSQVFRVTVSHTNPMPIYCSQNNGQHCANGMVAVVNPANGAAGDLTLGAYIAMARAAGNAVSPQGGVFGGEVAPNESGQTQSQSQSQTTRTTTTTATRESESTTVTQTETDTQTKSNTDTETQTQTQTTRTTTTGDGSGTATTTGATGSPTETGNAAAGVGAPLAGLVAVAMVMFFV